MAYGKRILKRVDICVHITDSLCCTPEMNTTLYINYTPTKTKKEKRCIEPIVHLHVCNVICQLYLNKDGKNFNKINFKSYKCLEL